MSCTRHFLSLQWAHHQWERQVSRTERVTFQETDQWGRRYPQEYVRCHARYVCQACASVRDGEECACEPDEAARCAVRLALLAGSGSGVAIHASV